MAYHKSYPNPQPDHNTDPDPDLNFSIVLETFSLPQP